MAPMMYSILQARTIAHRWSSWAAGWARACSGFCMSVCHGACARWEGGLRARKAGSFVEG